MIIALAGRRIDAPDAKVSRFPLDMTGVVRKRIKDLFVQKKAERLVCSAACGSDLLALDAAGDLGMQRRVVLPFSPDRFRETSVTDRPGDWGTLFDRIIEEVTATGNLVVLEKTSDDDQAYAAANLAILENAVQMQQDEHPSPDDGAPTSEILAVAVWDGTPRGEGDLTAAFLEEARRLGLDTADVLTTENMTLPEG